MKLFDRLLIVITILIPYQIYLPSFYKDKNVTLYMIVVAVGVFLYFFKERGVVNRMREIAADRDQRPVLWYLGFFMCIVGAFFYSGNKVDAVKHILFLGMGILIYVMFAYRGGALTPVSIARVFLFSSVPLAIMVLVVFVFKEHQYAILGSPIMKIFIEPDTLRNMLADRYFCNVLDAGRAGGLFVNAQEGAQFAGFNLLIVGWLWSKQRSNIFPLIGVLWLCALIAFGTMTGVIACALTMLCGLVLLTVKRKWSVIPSLIVVMFIIAGVVLMPWLQPRLAKYRTFDSSVNGRSRIWHASALVIGDHWVKGVGLDSNSWERAYAPHAEKVGAILKVPPHNVFLFVWAKAGILAFLCFVGFFISAICRYSLDFLRSGDTYALLVAMAFIWFGAECMTENFLIMDLRLAGALWMIMGLRVK